MATIIEPSLHTYTRTAVMLNKLRDWGIINCILFISIKNKAHLKINNLMHDSDLIHHMTETNPFT